MLPEVRTLFEEDKIVRELKEESCPGSDPQMLEHLRASRIEYYGYSSPHVCRNCKKVPLDTKSRLLFSVWGRDRVMHARECECGQIILIVGIGPMYDSGPTEEVKRAFEHLRKEAGTEADSYSSRH